MNSDRLYNIAVKAGLSDSQAKAYVALTKNTELTPTELAKITGESRENCYNIAKRLMALGLAEKTTHKKTAYRALPPDALQNLAADRLASLKQSAANIKQNINALSQFAKTGNIHPDLSKTIEEILQSSDDCYIFCPDCSQTRLLQVKTNHATYVLTPDEASSRQSIKKGTDQKLHITRTLMSVDAYDSEVEIVIYGNKTAFLNYITKTATLLDDPAITEAIRQIFRILCEYFSLTYPQIATI